MRVHPSFAFTIKYERVVSIYIYIYAKYIMFVFRNRARSRSFISQTNRKAFPCTFIFVTNVTLMKSYTARLYIEHTKCALNVYAFNFFFFLSRTRAFHKWNAFEHENNARPTVSLLEHLTPNGFCFCNTFNLHRFRVYQFYRDT